MEISYLALLGWTMPLGLVAFAVGIWPTWQAGGALAVWSQVTAGAVVLATVMGSGVIVCRMARRGPARAAVGFIFSCMGRILLAVALTLTAWRLLELHLMALAIWLVIFYLALLIGESIWLSRALRQDAFLEALGEFDDRPKMNE